MGLAGPPGQSCPCGARDQGSRQKEFRRKIREILKEQKFTNTETQKLVKKYDAMPDKYYDGVDEVGPVCFGSRRMMEQHGFTPAVPVQIWEWMAGSATLSTTARDAHMDHLPPIDHRWGFHMGTKPVQEKLLFTQLVYGTDVLFAAPTCTPWGGHARGWDAANRDAQRLAQSRTLQFLGAACVVQLCLGRHFVLENPHASDLWTESALRHLAVDMPKTVLDQCQFNAQMEGQFVKKTTDLVSSAPLPMLARRCDGSHPHLHLRGKNSQGSRAAQSAVYSDELCKAMLEQFRTLPSNFEGGRVAINFDSMKAPWDFKQSIVSLLTELRVHAMRIGHLKLFDLYVNDWVNKNYGHDLPRLPVDAELHLLSPQPKVLHKEPTPVPESTLRHSLDRGNENLRAIIKEELNDFTDKICKKIESNTDSTAQLRPRACGVEGPPNWAKEFEQNSVDAEDDPFARGSGDPAPDLDQQLADRPADPPTRRDGPAPPGAESAAPEAPSVVDLVNGIVPTTPWQFNPYDRKVATWLAAAQRRHMHRRRSNALLGVASVDLSGPHEPTPMIGQRLGHRPGHYFVVLVIEIDNVTGYKSAAVQTDNGDAEGDLPEGPAPEGSDDPASREPDGQEGLGEDRLPRLPLIYCEVVNQKAEAAAATERMLAQCRDEHGHLPSHAVFRLHSDKGQEFCPHSLEKYCQAHGIRRTTTAGYDPSANGAGEQAIGYIKRKARQLLTGARLPSCWWGVACVTAAQYSRCAAGLYQWPKLGFGTRAMLVQDPKPRNAFVPRSQPCTVFGPSSRVPGGYVLYQDGKVRESVNLQPSNLEAEELTFVKAHLKDWDTPIAPSDPPQSEGWDPRVIDQTDVRRPRPGLIDGSDLALAPGPDAAEEAPQVEELPQPMLVRIEEVINELDAEEDMDGEAPQATAAKCLTPAASALRHASGPTQPREKGKKIDYVPRARSTAIAFPHAFLTLSEVSEHTAANSDHSLLDQPAGSLDGSPQSGAAATDGSAPTSDGVSTGASADEPLTELGGTDVGYEFTDDDEDIIETVNVDHPCGEVDEISDLEPIWLDPGDPRAQELDYSSGPEDVAAPQPQPPKSPPTRARREKKKLTRRQRREQSKRTQSTAKGARGKVEKPPGQPEGLCVPRGQPGGTGESPEPPSGTGEHDDDFNETKGIDMVAEPGARIVPESEVRKATGMEYGKWREAAEKELNESFNAMGAVTVTTPEERARHGKPLPMKAVWSIKSDDLHKCRGCICGNFQQKDPTEQLWTAQADTASVMAALRLSQLECWDVSKLDIKGAFMYAPLPDEMLIVVQPPAVWVRMGLVEAGTLWTVRKAVYGLRVSPRAWGQERDSKFAQIAWSVDGQTYRLKQCYTDTQVWKVIRVGQPSPPSAGVDSAPLGTAGSDKDEFLGLMVCYVDDLLLLMKNGAVKQGLLSQLRALWKLSTEVDLKVGSPVTFLGLELELDRTGSLHIHQRDFIRKLLVSYGLDNLSTGIAAVQMALPTEADQPPDAKLLKELQKHAGEFNWLATRTRPDLSYFTSVIASAAQKHGDWTKQLCRKVLRYLLKTRDQGLIFPRIGSAPSGSELHDRRQLTVWSDAGYGGAGTKAQTGVLISWAGAVVLARSSRQTNSAMSTCESEVAAAAQSFVCCEGLRCLLEEWELELLPPILLVDNKSALTVLELGGSWRTRYFAVRAARIAEEYARERVQLRYCATKVMAADGLTKLASAEVLDMLRQAMSAIFPALPDSNANFKMQDANWWGDTLRVHAARRPAESTLRHSGAVPPQQGPREPED